MIRIFHRLFCLHYWVRGGVVNYMDGTHEYTCIKCGKKTERNYDLPNYEDF